MMKLKITKEQAMRSKNITSLHATGVTLAIVLGISGCGSSGGDLREYVAEVKAKPAGVILPIPEVTAYQPFTYPVHSRDPFDASVLAEQLLPQNRPNSNAKIDANRTAEYLENFQLDSLSMVGTLRQNTGLWALIRTPDGTIQRVTPGNHMGKNYGKITDVSESGVNLIEVVSDGFGGYMERPAAIALISQ
jgi:type IV pilus assembly protein PilP